jgi:hypothetical protein
MKKSLLFIFIVMLIPLGVQATSFNTPVSNDLSYNECLNFQDSKIASTSSGYFGHCKKATCYTGEWQTDYYISSDMVSCTNGNYNQYTQVINSGCEQYTGSCTPTTSVKYCSVVVYYDCTKTKDGKLYISQSTTTIKTTTTTTTKRTTTKKGETTSKKTTSTSTTTTTTTTTTPPTTTVSLDNNNYLSSLKISEGQIDFDKNTIMYNIEIDKEITFIDVEASPESSKSSVVIENNKEISEDKPITITVTAEDKSVRIYTINITFKEEEPVLSSNNLIKSLEIENYKIKFKSNTNNYRLTLKDEVKSLNISVELEDENASFVITGNENLVNKSKIRVVVTAENGSENIYTIKIRKSNHTGLALIIILIVGIICTVGFKLIRNLIPARKDSNYDYE